MAGEVRDPQRNIPRAFVLAVVAVGALYLLANASYFYALTPLEVASPVASEVLRRVWPCRGGAAGGGDVDLVVWRAAFRIGSGDAGALRDA